MTDQTIRRDLDAATGYQELLVPALMQEWAPRVADAAAIRAGDRVLDVACGTGVLTREAARRAGPSGAVTGLDLSPEMLAVAARLSPALRWQQGSGEALPFPDRSFDAVVSQFGLMFFPDPVAGLREMMRVLAPGGWLAVAVWGSLADTPAYAAEVALVERLAGKEAADGLRAPFVLGDPKRMAALCAAAGIEGARVSLRPGHGRFPNIRTMVEVDVRDWLRIVGITLDQDLIETILRESETALRPFVTIDAGGVGFDSPAVLASATR
jgi:SAM-dependent methyltransferase